MAQQSAFVRVKRAVRPFRFAAVLAVIVLALLLTYIGAAGVTVWLAKRGSLDPQIAWTLNDTFFDPVYMYIRSDGPGAWIIREFLRLCGGDL